MLEDELIFAEQAGGRAVQNVTDSGAVLDPTLGADPSDRVGRAGIHVLHFC